MDRLSPVQVDGNLITGWLLWDTDTWERTQERGQRVQAFARQDDAYNTADRINAERGH